MTKPAYVRVVIDRAIHRELDYLVPETLAKRVGVGSRVRPPRAKRCKRSPAYRSSGGRSAYRERANARVGAVDQRLLLLPDRNGDAQSAAASNPAR